MAHSRHNLAEYLVRQASKHILIHGVSKNEGVGRAERSRAGKCRTSPELNGSNFIVYSTSVHWEMFTGRVKTC